MGRASPGPGGTAASEPLRATPALLRLAVGRQKLGGEADSGFVLTKRFSPFVALKRDLPVSP